MENENKADNFVHGSLSHLISEPEIRPTNKPRDESLFQDVRAFWGNNRISANLSLKQCSVRYL